MGSLSQRTRGLNPQIKLSSHRFVVTGASGFVGSSLCAQLENKYQCIPVSRASFYCPPNVLTLEMLTGDNGLDNLQKLRPTHLIHCAAIAHRRQPQNHAEHELIKRVNVDLPVLLAKIAIESGVRRFVFLSSVGVHGSFSQPGMAINEDSPLAPANAYAKSKADAENLLTSVLSNSTCELVILRPALVYGPHSIGNLKILRLAVDFCLPFPFSAISNRRSFVALPNLLSAIEHVSLHPHANGKAYLIADQEYVSTSELVKAIAKARCRPCLQFPVRQEILENLARLPLFGAKLKQLVYDLVIDSSKIRNELGWSQPVSQADALLDAFTRFN